MNNRPETRKYTFTVEGETERWYLYWLRDAINASESAKFKVAIDAKVQQSPIKYAKGVNPKSTPEVIHICDVESNEDVHVQKFQRILSELKEANEQKSITYNLGYSNFTFELWMVLHKKNCNGALSHRSQYLSHINQAFGEKFENLDQYKHEDNFKRCLSKLSLEDVKAAIKRSKEIMNRNKSDNKKMIMYKGFKYYQDNPALTIYEAIEKILGECVKLK